jgi:septum formation protein
MLKTNKKIILASTSSIRKKILSETGINFVVEKPLYDEDEEKKFLPKMSCKKLSIFLASQKALSLSNIDSSAYIIGVDQVCEIDKKPINKSNNFDEAFSQLKKFNNNVHYQNNALIVVHNNKIIFKNFTKVSLKMRQLSDAEIITYINSDQPFGCAGSYKYESMGKHLFEKIAGDYYAVLGLSIQPLLFFLHSNNIISI